MRLTLRIGAHRTGTASFLAFVAANQDRLASLGVACWGPDDLRADPTTPLMVPPNRRGKAWATRAAQECDVLETLFEELEDSGCDRLILCDPGVMGTSVGMTTQRQLYPMLSERLEPWVQTLEQRCDRIVLSIRPYAGFWASLVASRLAEGAAFPKGRAFAAMAAQTMTWRRVVEEIATSFPASHLVVTVAEGAPAMPERQLSLCMSARGRRHLPEDPDPAKRRYGRSPGPRKLRRLLTDRADAPAELPIGENGRWIPFSPAQQARMAAVWADDIAWLRSGAGGLATFIERADAHELRAMDRIRGSETHDRSQEYRRLERAG